MVRRRAKIAVVTWGANHNPVGRAHVLAEMVARNFEVEIVGFEFAAHGRGVWHPVRDGSIPITSHAGFQFPKQLDVMQDVGRTLDADAVLVSKPRLPAVATAAFAKEARNRGVVIDVDDWELSFVDAMLPADVHDVERIRSDDTVLTPYGRIWTQVCEPLVAEADGLTVSNTSLQDRFGGSIIPHARDERIFDPGRFDRATVRSRLGIDPDVRLLLFGGTPRRHKGVLELADAVAELGDPAVVLGLIATSELAELRRDLDHTGCPVVEIPPQPFHDMPALLMAADFTAVLQDPVSAIARLQMPAKITDALAMQVPCIVNPVPPLRALIDGGHLEVVGPDGLTATLKRLLDDFGEAQRRARANRELFLEQFSHAAVTPVLSHVMRAAMDDPQPLGPGLRTLLSIQRDLFGTATPAATTPIPDTTTPQTTTPEFMAETTTVAPSRPSSTTSPLARRRFRPAGRGGPFDLVVFWKQNDSGIYGRRSDLLVREVSRSDRVARTIQFDAALGIEALRRMGQTEGIDHHQLVFDTTIRRILGEEDEDGVMRHTFLFDDRGDQFDLPRRDQFGDFVAEVFDSYGVGERDVVFWFYPTNSSLPALVDRFLPNVVVTDVVDDNRTWYPVGSNDYQALSDNYAAILGRSDVVLANCAAVRDAMSEFHPNVALLPNACEPPEPAIPAATRSVPEELRGLRRPIVGYVGNLSSRIDVSLIDHVAITRPDWSVVLIGSAHAGQDVLNTARHPNVTILGPRRYDDVKRYIDAFDVAMIPHLDNVMTRSMNPLKAFVYCSLGVPVVATAIANLDELGGMITVASQPKDFIRGIERALRRGRRPLSQRQTALLRANSWPVRAKQAMRLIEHVADEADATGPAGSGRTARTRATRTPRTTKGSIR